MSNPFKLGDILFNYAGPGKTELMRKMVEAAKQSMLMAAMADLGVPAQLLIKPPTPPERQLKQGASHIDPPPIRQLRQITDILSREYKLEDRCFITHLSTDECRFEVVAHEIIHSYLLSHREVPFSSSSVGDMIRDMPGWLANDHEIATLRCEAAALISFGCHVNFEWIWTRAGWRSPGAFDRWKVGPEYAPPLERLYEPLTVAEHAIVRRFDSLIKGYL